MWATSRDGGGLNRRNPAGTVSGRAREQGVWSHILGLGSNNVALAERSPGRRKETYAFNVRQADDRQPLRLMDAAGLVGPWRKAARFPS